MKVQYTRIFILQSRTITFCAESRVKLAVQCFFTFSFSCVQTGQADESGQSSESESAVIVILVITLLVNLDSVHVGLDRFCLLYYYYAMYAFCCLLPSFFQRMIHMIVIEFKHDSADVNKPQLYITLKFQKLIWPIQLL